MHIGQIQRTSPMNPTRKSKEIFSAVQIFLSAHNKVQTDSQNHHRHCNRITLQTVTISTNKHPHTRNMEIHRSVLVSLPQIYSKSIQQISSQKIYR